MFNKEKTRQGENFPLLSLNLKYFAYKDSAGVAVRLLPFSTPITTIQ